MFVVLLSGNLFKVVMVWCVQYLKDVFVILVDFGVGFMYVEYVVCNVYV